MECSSARARKHGSCVVGVRIYEISANSNAGDLLKDKTEPDRKATISSVESSTVA